MSRTGKSDLIREWLQGSGLTCGPFDIDFLVTDERDPLSCNWDAKVQRYAQLPWLLYITTAAEIHRDKRDGLVGLYANYQ